MTLWTRSYGHLIVPALLVVLCAGCDRLDMYDQPRYEALEASSFFQDGLSARPIVEGTVPRGAWHEIDAFTSGRNDKTLVREIPEEAIKAIWQRDPSRWGKSFEETDPVRLRQAMLERGRERFEIYCSVCHGRTGDGDGMIVQRGFRKPPTYHSDRLRKAPSGHIFDVVSNGFGAMAAYSNRVTIPDRWAIVSYVRALQLSQNASVDDVPEGGRGELSADRKQEENP